MLITKDTNEAQNKFFAIQDISRRAKAAVNDNPELFNSMEHRALVTQVAGLLEMMFVAFDAKYETARPATKRFPAHTEVKFSRVTLYDRGQHKLLKQAVTNVLDELGLDLIYKPNTNSYSVKVK